MNRVKWWIGALTAVVGLTAAGSGALAAPAAATQKAAATAAAKANPAMVNNLTSSTLIPLVLYAREIYFYTNRGGSLAQLETFTHNGQEFRYLSRDLGTRQQLLHYVKKAYTHNAAAFYVQTQFLENQGRMAQVNADIGNLLEFHKAQATMLSKDTTKAAFELKVPYPNNTQNPETLIVKLKKVSGYWRIDMSPDTLF
ncbi:DL-endopeptidase inhibitor IseA family protein [Paenibacillus glufosinatiresistens]|uniref:DL-endopeptidase inhibitor IseA family protein n=1 Tax=Paenibacillus glufosinatiresistens TaxID=3070657 RepID=UPI00286D978F|nr:DL-endopeptidase inhibitor IseA family protein [Paenibacillus sp. YX.27]